MADPGLQQLLLQAAERAEAGDFAQAAELSQQLLKRDEADAGALFLLGPQPRDARPQRRGHRDAGKSGPNAAG